MSYLCCFSPGRSKPQANGSNGAFLSGTGGTENGVDPVWLAAVDREREILAKLQELVDKGGVPSQYRDLVDKLQTYLTCMHDCLENEHARSTEFEDQMLKKNQEVVSWLVEHSNLTRQLPVHGRDELGHKTVGEDFPDGIYDANTMTWQNWGCTIKPRTLPQTSMYYPQTVEEVMMLVRNNQGSKFRAIGHGHSWTPVFGDGDNVIWMFMKNLKLQGSDTSIQIVRQADAAAGVPARVKVAAGVTTGELAVFLEDNADAVGHVALPSDVILNSVRYGGVISTACHGTGKTCRTIPDFLVEVTMINYKGVEMKYTAASKDFDVARASFGLMGLIVDMTIELDADLQHPHVQVANKFVKMREYLDEKTAAANFKKLVEENYAVELFWLGLSSMELWLDMDGPIRRWKAGNDYMWQVLFEKRLERQANPKRFENKPGVRELEEAKLGARLNAFTQKENNAFLQAAYAQFAFQSIRAECKFGWNSARIRTMPAAIHYNKAIDHVPCYDFEVCFPVKPDYSNVATAWRLAVKATETFIKDKKRNPMNVAMECRFTLGSEVTMSPAYHNGSADQLYCWLEVLGCTSTPLGLWLPFIKSFYDAVCEANQGLDVKMHWAKWNDINEANKLSGAIPNGTVQPADGKKSGSPMIVEDWITPAVQLKYARQIARLRDVVKAADPDGCFSTSWFDKVFQLKAGAV